MFVTIKYCPECDKDHYPVVSPCPIIIESTITTNVNEDAPWYWIDMSSGKRIVRQASVVKPD